MELNRHAVGWAAVIALASGSLYAGEIEDRAVQAIEKLGGRIARDETQERKPVIQVDLGGTKITDAGLRDLTPLNQLQWLSLKGTRVTDEGLKELANFERLRTLNLNDTKITDLGLRELAPLKRLQWLGLDGTAVTDKGVKEMVPFKQLETLVLGGVGITGAGLKELEGLDQLTELHLRHTKMTDAGIKHLIHLKHLKALHLIDAKVKDAGLKELASLKQLEALTLWNAQVTDVGLKDIAQLQQLQWLDLTGAPVTDVGLKELAHLKQLKTLSLVATKVSDAGITELAPLQQLEELALDETRLTDASLKGIARLKSLRGLGLTGTKLTGIGLRQLAGLMHLQRLYLGRTQVTDAGLEELAGMKHLQELYVPKTDVTDAGVQRLQKALPKCRIIHHMADQEEKKADAPPREPNAILTKAIEAHGGKKNILKPRKAHLKGIDQVDPKNTATYEDWFDLPSRWKRVLVDFPGGKKHTLFVLKTDGKLWQWEEGGEVREPDDADRVAPPYFGVIAKIVELTDKKFKLSPIKDVEVSGKTAVGLRVRWDKNQADCYFDQASGLLVRWDMIWEPKPNMKSHQKSLYEDYKETDGVKIPYRQRVYLTSDAGDHFQVADIVLKEAKILENLPEHTFSLPKKE